MNGDNKEKKLSTVKKMDVEFYIENGSLSGLRFIALDEEGCRIITDLMNGKISGLKYGQDTIIHPFQGGSGVYFFWVSETIKCQSCMAFYITSKYFKLEYTCLICQPSNLMTRKQNALMI